PTASHQDKFMATWAAFGRLKPGVTIAQARADLEPLFARSKLDIPLMFRNDTKLVVQPTKIHSLDPGAIATFEPLDETIGEMTAGPRFNSILVASFAALAFLMAIVGVYGVLSYAVTR